MKPAILVFLGFFALGCASAGSTVQGGPGGPGPAKVIMAAPSTFEVALEDEARQRLERHLARGSLEVARLVLQNLRPRAAESLKGVRIFIEKPDADARTPVDDPHYAGNFVLGLEASQSQQWNVAPTLSRLWSSGELAPRSLAQGKGLRITFVPEPWDFATALPKDFALPFESLTLEVPDR